MSFLVQPVCCHSSPKIGTSSSTIVGDPSNDGICRCPKATTATSLMVRCPSRGWWSEVLGVGVVRRVFLAGGPEVLDVLDRGAPLVARPPYGFDPHPHAHLAGVAAEDQVQERDVGAVEQHVGRHV